MENNRSQYFGFFLAVWQDRDLPMLECGRGGVPVPWDHKAWVSFKTLSTGESIGTVGKKDQGKDKLNRRKRYKGICSCGGNS